MPGLEILTEGNGNGQPAAPAPDAPPGSVLARLREQARQRRDRTHDVPLAAWDGQLVIRYQLPAMEDADRLVAASVALAGATTSPSGTPAMGRTAVDVMTTCCQTVLGATETGALEDLGVRLTGRLLVMLDLPLPPSVDDPGDVTASEVVEQLFFGNWIAVQVHASQVMTWLQEGMGGAELGEASAAS